MVFLFSSVIVNWLMSMFLIVMVGMLCFFDFFFFFDVVFLKVRVASVAVMSLIARCLRSRSPSFQLIDKLFDVMHADGWHALRLVNLMGPSNVPDTVWYWMSVCVVALIPRMERLSPAVLEIKSEISKTISSIIIRMKAMIFFIRQTPWKIEI